jgi:hypothetical protein
MYLFSAAAPVYLLNDFYSHFSPPPFANRALVSKDLHYLDTAELWAGF